MSNHNPYSAPNMTMLKISPMTPDKETEQAVKNALASNNADALSRLLDRGLDPNWKDGAGNTLLHHAARMGNQALVEKLAEKGAAFWSYNADGETPRDVAIVWGNDSVSALVTAKMSEQPAAEEQIPYKSLQEIRDASEKTGTSQFHFLAKRGQFAQVAALAEKDGGFIASDLLGKGGDGDTAVMKVAQQGELDLLLNTALWLSQPTDFEKVWESVPANYKTEHDAVAFASDLRQAKLQSYAKPKLPGLRRPPKPV